MKKIKEWKNRFFNKEKQKMLEGFYKEFFSYGYGGIGMWIAAGVGIAFAGMFCFMPYYKMLEGDIKSQAVVIMFAMGGFAYYVSPYISFVENTKQKRIYNKLKYLPISKKDIMAFCIKKLVKLSLKLLPIFLVGQIFCTWVGKFQFGFFTFWYPVGYGVIIPLIINIIGVLVTNYEYE